MKTKKIPLRTCVVTKENLPKKDLLRIVRTPEGEVKADETGKLNGRGAYIKKDLEVLEQARKILTEICKHVRFSRTKMFSTEFLNTQLKKIFLKLKNSTKKISRQWSGFFCCKNL